MLRHLSSNIGNIWFKPGPGVTTDSKMVFIPYLLRTQYEKTGVKKKRKAGRSACGYALGKDIEWNFSNLRQAGGGNEHCTLPITAAQSDKN